MSTRFQMSCPIPLGPEDRVLMAHGGGGRKSLELVRDLFGAALADPELARFEDAAVVPGADRIAMTTDSFVVSPLEFPGSDIGHLAVCGTVNDLAMVGATPTYLTIGFVLEEGLPLQTVWRIACSIRDAAANAGVRIVAADTKVVERGAAEGMYINTAGVGFLPPGVALDSAGLLAGDVLLLSGDIGRHGIAVMSQRAGLGFDSQIESDCAPLHEVAGDLAQLGVRCMRDLTRGGLASALVEIAASSQVEIELEETAVPVSDGVRGACEILGFDPMYVANEGRFVAFVAAEKADEALAIMRRHAVSAGATQIGAVTNGKKHRVVAKTALGSRRLVEMFSGEQLPRIC